MADVIHTADAKHLKHCRELSRGLFTAELFADIENLSAMALRQKYKHEANSHKDRKHACKGTFAPEFKKFRDFLYWLGKCPHADWTLDRIDNANPDYTPGGVRWASPAEQNANKSGAIMLEYDGRTQSLKKWADETGQTYLTLWKRRRHGWPPHEILYGRPKVGTAGALERLWRKLLPERYWSQWDRFEEMCPHVPHHRFIPTGLRSKQAGPQRELQWLALRLLSAAGPYIEQFSDALSAADEAGDEPEEQHVKGYEFWTNARARAWSVLFDDSTKGD